MCVSAVERRLENHINRQKQLQIIKIIDRGYSTIHVSSTNCMYHFESLGVPIAVVAV